MRKELNMEDMEQVAGGAAYINSRTNKIAFDSNGSVFQLVNCTGHEAAAVCSSLIGKYATEAEYDNACIAALRAKGWI